MATQTPSWFNDATYLANKLLQLQSSDPSTGWTLAMLNAELAKYNATPYEHFLAQGDKENVSPNAYFNVSEYLKAKAVQMNGISYEGKTDWSEATVLAEMSKYGVSAWDHYLKVGQFEGVNPSNGLDTDAYFTAKMNLLNSSAWDGRTDWTVSEVQKIFKEAGCSPITDPSPNVAVTAVAADKQVHTSYNPYAPNVPGATFTLTTGRDFAGVEDPAEGATFDNVIKMTAGDDTIEGVVSALSAENTFNARDLIDAGAGKDTAKIALNSNFTGFAADGGMKGVENVELTNAGAIAREFNATRVEGVEQYALNGVVSLTNLGDTKAAVNVSNVADTANVGIGFAAAAVAGTADALTVGVNALGTASVAATASAAAVAQKTVTVTANGIETLNVNTTGANFVALNGAQVANINVAGAGSITTTVAGTTKTFDASNNTGNVKVDLAGTTGVTKVATGAGDDTITVGVPSLTANAVVAGGEGNDRLELTGAGATTQLQMTGVETVSLGSAATALTGTGTVFSAAKATGIQAIDVQSNFGGSAVFATLGSSDLNVNLVGANANATANAVSLDQSGTTTINVSAASTATATAPSANAVSVTTANSSHVTLNVADKASYTGTINAGTASAVVVNGLVATGSLINAAAATSAVLNTTGASDLTLTAGKMTNLNATVAAGTTTAAGALDLTGSTLTGVQAVEANIGANSTLTLSDLDAANMVNLQGTGAAVLAAVGKNTQEYGVTVDAGSLSGLNIGGAINTGAGQNINVNAASVLGNVVLTSATVANTAAGAQTGSITVNANGTTGTVNTGTLSAKSVTVDAAGALGAVTYGAITVGDTLVINGSTLSANTVASIDVTGTSLTAVLNGGIGTDSFTIINTASNTLNYKVSGDLGIQAAAGSDDLSITTGTIAADAAKKLTIDVSGVTGAETVTIAAGTASVASTITGSAAADTITLNGLATVKNVVVAGAGDDIINNASVGDTLTGGAGADTFIFVAAAAANKGLATVTDFVAGEDVLNVAGGWADAAAVQATTATILGTALGTTVAVADIKAYALDLDGAAGATVTNVVAYNNVVYAIDGTGATDGFAVALTGVNPAALTEVVFAS